MYIHFKLVHFNFVHLLNFPDTYINFTVSVIISCILIIQLNFIQINSIICRMKDHNFKFATTSKNINLNIRLWNSKDKKINILIIVYRSI